MENYQEVLNYINYFNDGTVKFCTWRGGERDKDGVITMPYPDYDIKLHEFVKLVYDSGLIMKSYLNFLEEKCTTENDINYIIKNADFDTIRAVLTYFILQERFCDGMWERAVREKTFLNILYRLKELKA